MKNTNLCYIIKIGSNGTMKKLLILAKTDTIISNIYNLFLTTVHN